MSTINIQPQQNINKCPHGFPVGSCPICNGAGGGVSRDKNKPRVKGEMSYNECLAVWRKMQAQKQEKLNQKEELFQRALDKLIKNRELFTPTKILDKIIEPLPKILKNPVKVVLLPIIIPVIKIPVVIKAAQVVFINITNFISTITEKLSSLIGEGKNFIKGFFDKNKIKKKIKILLSLFVEEKVQEVEKEETDKNDKNTTEY